MNPRARSRVGRTMTRYALALNLCWGAAACADEDDEDTGETSGDMELAMGTTMAATDQGSTSTTTGDMTGSGTGGEDESVDTPRPTGWFPDSHDKNAMPRPDIVFPDDRVNEIHVYIEPVSWVAMQTDMASLLAEIGGGGEVEACEGKSVGDACTLPGLGDDNVCIDPQGELICVPDYFSPCEGLELFDECTTPFGEPANCLDTRWGLACFQAWADPCGDAIEGDSCRGDLHMGECVLDGESLVCAEDPELDFDLLLACETAEIGAPCPVLGAGEDGRCVEVDGRRHCESPALDDADVSSVPDDYVAKFFSRDPLYVPCRVEFQGRTWTHVGVRYKGNNSLASSTSEKRPFVLHFDYYEDIFPEIEDQRIYGYEKISFHNGVTDASLLRQRSASEIFQNAGVPAPDTAFYAVYVHVGDEEKFLGMHTGTEYPAKPLLMREFGNHDGNLYKPDGRGAYFREFIATSFHRKNNETSLDFSDAQRFVTALNAKRDDEASWKAEFEAAFDMPAYLRFNATNHAMDNWDTYGGYPHNFYLYNNQDNGKLTWIAWDFDLSLSYPAGPMQLSLAGYGGEWPLLQVVARDADYAHAHHLEMRRALDGAFAQQANSERWARWAEMIRPYVVREFGSSEQFDTGVAQLQDHLISHWMNVDAYLEARGY